MILPEDDILLAIFPVKIALFEIQVAMMWYIKRGVPLHEAYPF